MSRPEDKEKTKGKSSKTTFRREDKSWRANSKPTYDEEEDELEELMLKINQQFKCNACGFISSIFMPECNSCGEANPNPAIQTH